MKKIDADISVVVPVYNSQNTISKLLERLSHVLNRFDHNEIILVDDKSSDQSWEIIKEQAKKNSNITGITLTQNSGQQSAILCGLRHARYGYSVIIDDDLEQNPDDIIKLYEKMLEGYDSVYAIVEYSGARGVGSVMRDLLFRMLTDIPKGIKVSSFRIMNKETRDAVIKAQTDFVYISMEILKSTQNIGNIAINKGASAKSNYTFKSLVLLYKNIFRTYSKSFLFRRKKMGDCYFIDEIVGDEK